MADYATVADVEARWRTLTAEEAQQASVLIHDASLRVKRRFQSTDSRIVSGDLDIDEVTSVVAGMVKRAMIAAADGVTQQSQTAGPFGASLTFGNPMGNLYFTAEDEAVLATPARTYSVKLTSPNL